MEPISDTVTVRCRLRLSPMATKGGGVKWLAMWDDSSAADPGDIAVIVEVTVPVPKPVFRAKVVAREQ